MTQDTPIVGIFGNHDCAQPQLTDDDSLSVLVKSGGYQIVSAGDFWTGEINQRRLVVAGSSYRHPVPKSFDTRLVPRSVDKQLTIKQSQANQEPPLVIWLTHHDIDFKGYESGRFAPHEIDNVDVLINGHIHRRLAPMVAGRTTWINPGNISRRTRSESNQAHVPKALQVSVSNQGLKFEDVVIPHKSFEEVFHPAMVPTEHERVESAFVAGLKELTHRRTASGAGLHEFLRENIDQFEPDVAHQILTLAKEITQEDIPSDA
jgi:predicted phosphodiesterase